jgi:uncharacterized protein YjiS (DUF1127 family)
VTTIDIEDGFTQTVTRPTNPIRRWFAAWRKRRTQRIALDQLSHLDSYLLRDMGIEPQDIRDALAGRDSSLLFNPVRRHGAE